MENKKVFILGGYGETGRRLANYLVDRTHSHIIITGRNKQKADALAAELNEKFEHHRATALQFDASNHESIARALAGMDFFIQAGPALPVETVHALASAVIEVGADWMDVQVDPKQAEVLSKLKDRMNEKGCCFATQGGFHPGLPGALVRYAAKRFDSLEVAETAGYINPKQGLILTSGVDELIDIFRDYSAQVFENREWRTAKTADMRKFDFGFGIGPQLCAPMTLDEMTLLPEQFPSLRQTGFFVGGFDWASNYITIPLIMAGVKLFPRIKPFTWGKLLCWSHRTFNRPPYGTCLVLVAEGLKNGERVSYTLSLLKDDEYELTAIPMVATIEQMFDGTAHKPGLHRMALLCEPERLIRDMKSMGVRFEEKE